ncbi:MAG: S23 ribosomal protein [Microgenomates group bacterium GW2011_GWB1_44_8]|nr:MAG: S23 ribosomal protein [Microgenomates group bacterium GW2011_GWB1_44_8]
MAKQFEDLYCWRLARELVNLVYNLTDKPTFRDFSLKDQIRRAAVSIVSNIAEGFERGTRDEFLYFLYIAKGSCGEARAQLYVALDRGFIGEVEFDKACDKCKEVSAVLYRFIEGFKAKGYSGIRRRPSSVPTSEDTFLQELRDKYLKK